MDIESRGRPAPALRLYHLAREFGQPWAIVARVLRVQSVTSVAQAVSDSDAARIRADWAAASPERIEEAAAHYHAQNERDQATSDHENRRQLAPDQLTAKDIGYRFDINSATIRKWVERGHLAPVGTEGRANLYSRADVERVAQETAGRSKSHSSPKVRGAQDVDSPFVRVIGREVRSRVNPDQMLDAAAAAELVDVTTSTIRVWVNRGHLHPSGRSGRKHLYRALDVLAAARART